MEALTLTNQQARRFVLAHQGLWPPYAVEGKAGVLDTIRRAGCIQFDPLNIVGRNPELVLQARVSDFRPAMLEVVTWQEREALRLEDGLALIPGYQATDASVEVLIGADGPAYPGVAFCVADALNYELVYAGGFLRWSGCPLGGRAAAAERGTGASGRGENVFQGSEDRAARGYAELGVQSVAQMLSAGVHTLAATLRVSEPFGWGLALAARGEGEGLRCLPVELG